MQILVLRELTPAQEEMWRAFLRVARTSHPEQDLRFTAALRAQGQDVAFAMGFEGGELCAVGLFALHPHPFLKGRYRDAMAYSGPVCDDFDRLTQFLTGLAQSPLMAGVGRLRVTPYWLEDQAERLGAWYVGQGWRGFEYGPMRHTGLIDLTGSDDDIQARFSQTGRRKIRKAEKLGLTVHVGLDGAEAQDFLQRLNSHHQSRRIATIPEPVFQALQRDVLQPGDLGSIITVRHEGRFLAGALTYRSPGTAHFLHSVHDDAALAALDNLRVSPFLLFQTMKWARGKGCTRYDIEGYRANPAPDDPHGHIFRYKSEFNPREVLRVAGHYRVINPMLHLTGNAREILRSQAKALRARARRRVASPPVAGRPET